MRLHPSGAVLLADDGDAGERWAYHATAGRSGHCGAAVPIVMA
jgi:hypothetical protein